MYPVHMLEFSNTFLYAAVLRPMGLSRMPEWDINSDALLNDAQIT